MSTITAKSEEQPSPFVALQHRDFRMLWMGQLISEAGTQMQLVTINWHIYLLTGSAVALGLVGLMRVVPTIVFSLVAGVIADAHDRRRMLLITQSSMTLLAVVLALLTHGGRISVGIIYALSALTATAVAFDNPARQALPPNLVPREHLMNALSLNSIMQRTSQIGGPGIAGFIIAWKGVEAIYWINAASFLAVLAALFLIKTPTQQKTGAARITFSTLSEGVRFVRTSRILLSTMLLDFLGTFFSSASALLPIFARDILRVGPQGFGILHAAQSVGAVCAGIWMSFAGNLRRKGKLLLWAVAVYGTATAFYGASHWFILSAVFLFAVGAANTISVILRQNIRQVVTPDNYRGRMNSVNAIFANSGHQLGNLEAGLAASLIGAQLSVITGGVATVVTAAMVIWLAPQLKDYED